MRLSYVFMSHSHGDKVDVRDLVNQLLDNKFNVWIDEEDIQTGDEWEQRIYAGIKASDAVTIVMSSNSQGSDWVKKEFEYAVKCNKPVLPILLEGDGLAYLQHFKYEDIRTDKCLSARFYNRLAQSVSMDDLAGVEFSWRERQIPVHTQPFFWYAVPSGRTVLMDVNKRRQAAGDDFEVAEFYMAKYPITNRQYELFVRSHDGYRNKNWWNFSQEASTWRGNHSIAVDAAFDNSPDDPRTNVTWYEAIAFCSWLTAVWRLEHPDDTQTVFTLPTELQWQYAAQGTDQRMYPWGNSFDSSKCNTIEAGFNRTIPVTRYDDIASPYSMSGMSGNVWEWCRTRLLYPKNLGLEGDWSRAIRGGAFDTTHTEAQTSHRESAPPTTCLQSIGFRIVRIEEQ